MMNHKQHVEYIDHMGTDLRVVDAARISFAQLGGKMLPAGAATDYEGVVYQLDNKVIAKGDAKLISYLAKHNHWTPFAHPQITLRMKAPVPIRTQCFKHKQGFVENEESRRYISSKPEYYMPVFRQSTENKKQGSGKEFGLHRQELEQVLLKAHMDASILSYEAALARGVCEEQARFYLPQGMMVNWYWTGSLAAYARFARQRMDSHAQKETQELARMASDIIQPLYPVSWKALME